MGSAIYPRVLPFGGYYLLERLAIGGMAEVYLAKTDQLTGQEQLVALKRILPNISENDEFIAMFIDEAKIAGQLGHANIAQIYDLGKIDSSYFIAMEYISGHDLRATWDRARSQGPIPLALACHVIKQVCEGLDYAHRRRDNRGRPLGIIHRDVSPQNVLISYDGRVKVIDFGIAKAANRMVRTQTGILKGKFAYMAPEQARGTTIDHRADIFAIGVMLWEMIAGERAFKAESDFLLLEKVRNADVQSLRAYRPDVPEELERITMKALAADPRERYAWGSALAADLDRLIAAHGLAYDERELAAYMRHIFRREHREESERLAEFRAIDAAGEVARMAGGRVGDASPHEETQVLTSPGEGTLIADLDSLSAQGVRMPWEPESSSHIETSALLSPGLSALDTRIPADHSTRENATARPREGTRPDVDTALPTFPTDSARLQPGDSEALSSSLHLPHPSDLFAGEDSHTMDTVRDPHGPPAALPPITAGAEGSATASDPVHDADPTALDGHEPAARRPRPEAAVGRSRAAAGWQSAPPPVLLGAGAAAGLVLGVGLGAALFGAPDPATFVTTTPPGAAVSLGESMLCPETPCWVRVPTGPVELTIAKPGFRPAHVDVLTDGREPAVVNTTLKALMVKPKLRTAPAGAKVVLDGKTVGKTPVALPAVRAGSTHRLVLSKPGFATVTESWTVQAGQNVLERRLVSAVTSWTVEVKPVDAMLSRGGTRRYPVSVRVDVPHDKTRLVRGERPGCITGELEVNGTGDAAKTDTIHLNCRPFDARLSVQVPRTAQVYIDGMRMASRGPLREYPLPAGSYEVYVKGRRTEHSAVYTVDKGAHQELTIRVR